MEPTGTAFGVVQVGQMVTSAYHRTWFIMNMAHMVHHIPLDNRSSKPVENRK
jgi:hypothetical protein